MDTKAQAQTQRGHQTINAYMGTTIHKNTNSSSNNKQGKTHRRVHHQRQQTHRILQKVDSTQQTHIYPRTNINQQIEKKRNMASTKRHTRRTTCHCTVVIQPNRVRPKYTNTHTHHRPSRNVFAIPKQQKHHQTIANIQKHKTNHHRMLKTTIPQTSSQHRKRHHTHNSQHTRFTKTKSQRHIRNQYTGMQPMQRPNMPTRQKYTNQHPKNQRHQQRPKPNTNTGHCHIQTTKYTRTKNTKHHRQHHPKSRTQKY
mmetsp:Transcript_29539/g.47221  ORF Transcript_29539/g.47221 Transcript_29539/m.47221 type:complete len:255 (+) Transcript_29539:1013-1777(+)